MSQAKSKVVKYQSGTGEGGIQPNKIRFVIDNNEYNKDEQFLNDQFNGFFDNLKKEGLAKESDRSAWLGTHNAFVNQAKGGTYSIKPSSDGMLSMRYMGGDENSILGMDESGNPHTGRKFKDDNQRMSYLIKHYGDALTSDWRATNKAKADEEAKAKSDAETRLKGERTENLNRLGRGIGSQLWGKDWDTASDVLLGNYWKGDDASRLNQLKGAYTSKFKELFNNEYDEDEFKSKYGVSLSDFRKSAESVYDPLTGNLKGNYSKLTDMLALANIYDTIGADNALIQRAQQAGSSDSDSDDADVTKVTQVGKGEAYRTKDGKLYRDKNLKQAFSGIGADGLFYNNGYAQHGRFFDDEDYYSDYAGDYIKGKKVTPEEFSKYYNDLSKDRFKNKSELDALDLKNKIFKERYYNRFYNRLRGLSQYGDTSASRFIGSGIENISRVAGLNTALGLDGNKGKVIEYSTNELDQFGYPKIYNAIRLSNDDGTASDFRGGRLRLDRATGGFYYVDAKGNRVEDPRLTAFLKGINRQDNADYDTDVYMSYKSNSSAGKPLLNAAGRPAYTGMPNFQVGGVIKMGRSKEAPTRSQANIQDMASAATSSDYKLSNIDKAELAGLGLDVAAFATSLTGAGSLISGGLGAASTITQFGADWARDGLDWGDVGRAGLNLGLDAISFAPGVGSITSALKLGKTIKGLSKATVKGLQMGLIGAGAQQAGSVLWDLATTDKKITDLTIDDQRALLNGMQAIIGGSRLATNKLATKKTANTNTIALKDGEVKLTDNEVANINQASDKIAEAKRIIAAKKNIKPEQVELATTKGWGLKKSINPISRPIKETVNIKTEGGQRVLKNAADYSSNSPKDRYMRWLIDKAALRNSSLSDNIGNQTGLLGDYFRSSRQRIPESRRLEANAGPDGSIKRTFRLEQRNPRDVVETRSPNFVDNRIKGSSDRVNDAVKESEDVMDKVIGKSKGKGSKSAISKRMNRLNKDKKAGDQMVMFQRGGITPVKTSLQTIIPGRTNPYLTNLKGLTPALPTAVDPNELSEITSNLEGSNANNLLGRVEMLTPKGAGNLVDNTGTDIDTTASKTPGGFLKNVNTTALSELGRALFVRRFNSLLDTRVERPMVTAPAEISVPVRGNMLAKNAYDRAANQIVASTRPVTSDAGVNAAMNLQANSRAADIRLQGDMINNEALERTRQQSLENDMRNAGVRANVANQNTETLARATQAERTANNAKLVQMNTPLNEYWKQQNFEAGQVRRYNKGIDDQIRLLGLEEKFRTESRPMQNRVNEIEMELANPNIDATRKAALNAEYQKLITDYDTNRIRMTKEALATRRYAKGGAVTATIKKEADIEKENIKQANQNNREVVKQNQRIIAEDARINNRIMSDAMRNVNELIKLALS